MKNLFFCLLSMTLLIACTPKPEQIAPYVLQTLSAWPTQTPYATATNYSTYTALPSYTPWPTYTPKNTATSIIKIVTQTLTPTPINTMTPTPTWPSFNQTNCVSFAFPSLPDGADIDLFDRQLQALVGKCVKFFFDGDQYVFGTDLIYMRKAALVVDEETSPDIKKPDAFSMIWGMLESPSTTGGPWRIHLRKVTTYPQNQQPIMEEGLYTVGVNNDISPGLWKSGLLSTWTDSCYWARINPLNGDIKANHFGIGGITVRVYEGEVFETNDDCLDWYYVGQ